MVDSASGALVDNVAAAEERQGILDVGPLGLAPGKGRVGGVGEIVGNGVEPADSGGFSMATSRFERRRLRSRRLFASRTARRP